MVKFRIFQYIDAGVVNQFLAQLEGGEIDEQQIRDSTGRSTGLGASATFGPFEGSAERGRDSASEAEYVVRRTGPAKLNKLHAVLTESHELAEIFALDDAAWAEVEVGEIVEVRATIEVHPFFASALSIQKVAKLGPMIDAVEALSGLGLPGVEIDEAARRSMGQAKAALPAAGEMVEGLASGPVPCTFNLVGSPRVTLFAFLDQANLLVPVGDLRGELTLLAKVDRLVERRKPERIAVIDALPQLSREQRRKGRSTSPEVTLRDPAAVVTAVALYKS